MKICDYTMPELRYFLAECNFTEDEEVLFLLRTKDYPLEKCAEEMNVSTATVDRIHKRIKIKMGLITNEMYKSGFARHNGQNAN